MMNPYILLALGIAWLLSIVGADTFGYRRAENAAKAAQVVAVDAAINDANRQAEKDKLLAVANAQKEAQARTIASMLRTKTNEAITAKPLPVACDWSPASFGLLVASINAANNSAGPGDKLPDAVRRANAPGK